MSILIWIVLAIVAIAVLGGIAVLSFIAGMIFGHYTAGTDAIDRG